MIKQIKKWINYVSLPQELLGGLAICPFASKAKFNIISTSTKDIKVSNLESDIVIFKVEDNITLDDLTKVCKNLNFVYKDLIFLPDHKDRKTFINGVKTSNNKFNLILCQQRSKLNEAREKLKQTNYYNLWNEEYLKEILNF